MHYVAQAFGLYKYTKTAKHNNYVKVINTFSVELFFHKKVLTFAFFANAIAILNFFVYKLQMLRSNRGPTVLFLQNYLYLTQ